MRESRHTHTKAGALPKALPVCACASPSIGDKHTRAPDKHHDKHMSGI